MTETQNQYAASGEGPKPMAQQASDIAGRVKQQVTDVAQNLTSQVQEKASELVDNAKVAASEAGEQLRGAAEEKKNAGADFGVGVADAIRRAAGELDGHIPQAGATSVALLIRLNRPQTLCVDGISVS